MAHFRSYGGRGKFLGKRRKFVPQIRPPWDKILGYDWPKIACFSAKLLEIADFLDSL